MAVNRKSPKVNTTVSEEVYNKLHQEAAARGISISKLLSETLELMLTGFLYQPEVKTIIRTTKGAACS